MSCFDFFLGATLPTPFFNTKISSAFAITDSSRESNCTSELHRLSDIFASQICHDEKTKHGGL